MTGPHTNPGAPMHRLGNRTPSAAGSRWHWTRPMWADPTLGFNFVAAPCPTVCCAASRAVESPTFSGVLQRAERLSLIHI
eukprot:2474023-Alexandrium_andersonii.AAC.1